MNSDEVIKSIYNPKRKTKEPLVFPKISKAESTPTENKVFGRVVSRKYNNQNIFKMQDEKKEKAKLFQEERLREYHNRQCEQLQAKLAELMRKHAQQMRQIDEKEKHIQEEIEREKKKQYQIKYNLWQSKNQIMNLNAVYLEEEREYQRLCAYFQQQEQEEEMDGDALEAAYNEANQNAEEIQIELQQEADPDPEDGLPQEQEQQPADP